MKQRRLLRSISLLLALWMCAVITAAALSPLISNIKNGNSSGFALICTSAGIKRISLDLQVQELGDSPLVNDGLHHLLDCPACLVHTASAPPPSEQFLAPTITSYESAHQPSAFFLSRESLSALARGPPSA